jgi:hypothetical protein
MITNPAKKSSLDEPCEEAGRRGREVGFISEHGDVE